MTFRVQSNYTFGTLSVGCASGDLTLQSASFANLIALSPTTYQPLALQNPVTGAFEIVWATGHTGSSTSITVVRGKEGTTAQSWPANTLVGQPVLARDLLTAATASQLATAASDYSVGLRAVDTDNARPLTMTGTASWQPSVYGDPAGNTPGVGGVATPNTASVLLRSGLKTAVATNGSGDFTAAFAEVFPNGLIAVVAVPANTGQSCTSIKTSGGNASQFTGRAMNGTANLASTTVDMMYIAVGY